MKIRNETKWSTDDLRAIISAALAHRGVPSTGLVVEVVPSRHRISGVARIGKMHKRWSGAKEMFYGNWMKLRLPHNSDEKLKVVAAVIEHEVAHLQGLTHGTMSDALRWCTQEVSWLGELQLREEEKPCVNKAAVRADRLAHAERMLAKAETREKRATTLRKKWERRVRALERVGGAS
jgi:hypothetical protein